MGCLFKKEDGSTCGSNYNTKEVEFRHPDYNDLSVRVFLCEFHFDNTFGKTVLTKDHLLPLEEDEYLKRLYLREKDSYIKKEAEIKKKVKDGIGNDHFDWANWYALNTRKKNDLYEQWIALRKKTCRFEWCKARLTNIRNPYIIRVYPRTPKDYVNLFFCSLDHWEVFKKRIGIKTLKGSFDKKKAATGLEEFMEMPEKNV